MLCDNVLNGLRNLKSFTLILHVISVSISFSAFCYFTNLTVQFALFIIALVIHIAQLFAYCYYFAENKIFIYLLNAVIRLHFHFLFILSINLES